MIRSTISVLSTLLLILALLAAPVACAVPGMVDSPVAEAPECGGGCCHETPEESSIPDCCSSDFPGCPLHCCCGLVSMATGPIVHQEPGAAVPTEFTADQPCLPFVSPRPIEHPPRS